MGGAAPTPAKGGKRTMDAAVNLVPYIDLLMTIMTFLVMTAVWTQIAALEVQNQSGGPPEQEQEKDPDAPKPILVSIMEEKIQDSRLTPSEFSIQRAVEKRIDNSCHLRILRPRV